MLNKVSYIPTIHGEIKVETWFRLNWVPTILTFGLIRSGRHEGVVSGEALGRCRASMVANYEFRGGRNIDEAAKRVAAQTSYDLTPATRSANFANEYHEGALSGAKCIAGGGQLLSPGSSKTLS